MSAQTDDRFFILRRFSHSFVCLNLYPYNAGHLMVLPLEHQEKLTDISSAAQIEMMRLVSESTRILEAVLECHGINVGINLGKAAGAGMPGHLHIHVLPRWQGDTNFMPLLAQTKQISFNLGDIFKTLQPAFAQIKLD